jgi:hypothetical protein
MKMIIIHWVGIHYLESVLIAQILVIQLLFNFILIPASYLIMSTEKYKSLILISGIAPFLYLIPFYILYKHTGYILLPILKSTIIFINSIYSIYVIKRIIKFNMYNYMINPILNLIPSILLQIGLFFIYKIYWVNKLDKNLKFLSIDIFIAIIITLISITVYLFFNTILRKRIFSLFKLNFA